MQTKPFQHSELDKTTEQAETYTTDAEHKSKIARRTYGKERDGRYTRATMPKKVKRVKGKAAKAARRRNRK